MWSKTDSFETESVALATRPSHVVLAEGDSAMRMPVDMEDFRATVRSILGPSEP